MQYYVEKPWKYYFKMAITGCTFEYIDMVYLIPICITEGCIYSNAGKVDKPSRGHYIPLHEFKRITDDVDCHYYDNELI